MEKQKENFDLLKKIELENQTLEMAFQFIKSLIMLPVTVLRSVREVLFYPFSRLRSGSNIQASNYRMFPLSGVDEDMELVRYPGRRRGFTRRLVKKIGIKTKRRRKGWRSWRFPKSSFIDTEPFFSSLFQMLSSAEMAKNLSPFPFEINNPYLKDYYNRRHKKRLLFFGTLFASSFYLLYNSKRFMNAMDEKFSSNFDLLSNFRNSCHQLAVCFSGFYKWYLIMKYGHLETKTRESFIERLLREYKEKMAQKAIEDKINEAKKKEEERVQMEELGIIQEQEIEEEEIEEEFRDFYEKPMPQLVEELSKKRKEEEEEKKT